MRSADNSLDALTAKLLGHDPDEWFDPERATRQFKGKSWLIIRKDSKLVMFETEEQAWRFKRTGVMPDER